MTILAVLTHNHESTFYLPFYSIISLAKDKEMLHDMLNKILVSTTSHNIDYWRYPMWRLDIHGIDSKHALNNYFGNYSLKHFLGINSGKHGGIRRSRLYTYNTLLLSPTNYKLIKRQKGYIVTKDTRESIYRFLERELDAI